MIAAVLLVLALAFPQWRLQHSGDQALVSHLGYHSIFHPPLAGAQVDDEDLGIKLGVILISFIVWKRLNATPKAERKLQQDESAS